MTVRSSINTLDPLSDAPDPRRETGLTETESDAADKDLEDFIRGREQPQPPPVRRGPECSPFLSSAL